MTRRDTLLGVLLLCGGAAGVVVPTPHRADDTEDSEGAALLRCVRSVMERNAHGDKPTHADRLFYSHRRYFNRIWGADYLVREKIHEVKVLYSFESPPTDSPRSREISTKVGVDSALRNMLYRGGVHNAKTHSWGLRTLLPVCQWRYQPP